MLRSFTILLVASFYLLSSCGKAQSLAEKVRPESSDKILIVYLSRTKNTLAVAEMIKGYVGSRLVGLEL